MPPEMSPTEPLRLHALRETNLIETPLEERFERITRLTQRLLAADIVAISLIEADRQFLEVMSQFMNNHFVTYFYKTRNWFRDLGYERESAERLAAQTE